MIKVKLEAPDITYKVTRNGSVVAHYLTEPEFRDENMVSGTFNYVVCASSQGHTSDPSNAYSITLADVQVSVDTPAGGDVSGDGLYKVGDNVSLRATVYPGYLFKGWKEYGATVSTNPNYSFVVNADRNLTASFQRNNGVGENKETFSVYPNPVRSRLHVESSVVIRQFELITVDGVVVEKKEVNASEFECSVASYAKGVYCLRLVTEEGVFTKKIVLKE